MREFKGSASDPQLEVDFAYEKRGGKLTGNLEILITNNDGEAHTLEIADLSYGGPPARKTVSPGAKNSIRINTSNGKGWYDTQLSIGEVPTFVRRAAGRVETGLPSVSDPAMG
jgi:phospholipase C